MCGICGFVGKGDKEILIKMRDRMVHRGPDEEGYYFKPGIGLGHRRLKIIDLNTGQQPIHNEANDIWVVANGEIYNFRALRQRLEDNGHLFYTKTDTEVIIHAYEEWREDCIHHLRGMFAFAIWDDRRRRLLLVRDRLGIKPLYYAHLGDTFIFASEIKALLSCPQMDSRKIDGRALDMYLRLQFIPSPYTIFKDIRKVAPGHYVIWEKGDLCVRNYWKHRFAPLFKDEETWLDALEEKVLETVKSHLISDVPLGVFLSGGTDSTIILMAMRRYIKEPIKTFTIGFEDSSFDERSYAKRVASLCKTEHHDETVSPDIEKETFEKLVAQLDEPMSDSSFIPTFHISRLARKKVTVALSGDGGDETFSGYEKYHRWLKWQRWPKIKIPLAKYSPIGRRTATLLSQSGIRRFAQLTYDYYSLSLDSLYGDVIKGEIKKRHREYDIWSEMAREIEQGEPLSLGQHADFLTYLPEDILMKVDKMSMSNSLEVRVPLLDYELQELIARMPQDLKYQRGVQKYILKRLLERWQVPNDIIQRPKMGFAPSLSYWFSDGWQEKAYAELRTGTSVRKGIFNAKGIDKAIGRQDKTRLWNLWIFEVWARQYMG